MADMASYRRGVCPLYRVTNEARLMPGVKKLHQESGNSSKAPYILGHLFGAVGVLMGAPGRGFCFALVLSNAR